MVDPYLNLVYNSKFGLNINAGGRLNSHSDYGNHWVYNFNPSFQFAAIPLKLLASYSTAFVSPSLYQLFSSYGDINLTPEKNKTAEAGFEMGLLQKKIKLNAVAFLREDQNSIAFDLVNYKYFNQNRLKKITGIETMVGFQITSNLNFNANYTFNELGKTARELNPKHKFNAVIDWETTSNFGISLVYQTVSQRYFEYTSYPAPTFSPILNSLYLKSYELFDANIRYKLGNKNLHLFASVTNILNKDYEELYGYNTKGRNFKVGLNIKF
jgi:vitamin B12 transporter